MSKQQNHMVDFRKVKDSVSITRILEHYDVLDEYSKRGDRLEGPCPIHDGDSRSFSITPAKNTWYCFGQCKQGGNILDLVAKMEKCGVRDAAIKISNWFNLDNVEHKPAKQKKPKPDRPPKKSGKNSKKQRRSAKNELSVEDKDDHKRPDDENQAIDLSARQGADIFEDLSRILWECRRLKIVRHQKLAHCECPPPSSSCLRVFSNHGTIIPYEYRIFCRYRGEKL